MTKKLKKVTAAVFVAAFLLTGVISCASKPKNEVIPRQMEMPQTKTASPAGKPSAKRHSDPSLLEAIEQSAEVIAGLLPKGSRVAIVAFESESDKLSDFMMEEFTGALVARGIEVADRQNIGYLETEFKFQMSGAVDDDQVKRVGQFLAADMVITGQLLNIGNVYRYQTNAVHLEQAARTAVTRVSIPNDAEMQKMVASLATRHTSVKTATYASGDRTTPGANLDCGILFLNRGELDMAINCFNQTIMQNPNMAMAYFFRGRVYVQKKEARKAYDDFTMATKLDPNLAEAHHARAVSLYETDTHRDSYAAIEGFTKAIELNPNYADAYNDRGLVYSRQGRLVRPQFPSQLNLTNREYFDRAYADFSKTIELDPNRAWTYFYRALTYDDVQRTSADLAEAVRLAPDDVDMYLSCAAAYAGRGMYDKAIENYEAILRINPKSLAGGVARSRMEELKRIQQKQNSK